METLRPCGVRPSLLERFFAQYEFTCKYQLSCSNCEDWTTKDVLERASTEHLKLWDNASLGYTESLGNPLLLQEIWNRYRPAVEREHQRQGSGGSLPHDVNEQKAVNITACVPVEGIFIVMTQLLDPGDIIIAMDPAYQALLEIARSRACEIISWTPHYDTENFWDFNLADLKSLLQKCQQEGKRLKMLILNSPHNPTGVSFSQRELDQIIGWLQEFQEMPILFSDEMYGAMLGETAPTNVGRPNSIVLSGLSKPWGMPGLRMGWLIMENRDAFEKVAALRDYTTLCLPVHSEILSIMALNDAEAFLKRNRQICEENYRILQDFLLKMPDWFYPLDQEKQVDKSSGFKWRASTVFPRLKQPLGGPGYGRHLQTPTSLAQHLASDYGICMIVSDFFEFDYACVRFGIGLRSFPKSLQMLGEALKDISKKAKSQYPSNQDGL